MRIIKTIGNVICLLMMVYIVYIMCSYIEFFSDPVQYNADEIPENKLESDYDKESVMLTDLFNKINIKDIPGDYKDIFKNISNYHTLIVSDEFNKKIKELFLDNGLEISIIKDSYNIYYTDKTEDSVKIREYIFNINIKDKEYNTLRILLVYLKINNIENYLTDTGDFYPYDLINLRNDLKVNCINLDDLVQEDSILKISSFGENNYYYKIPSILEKDRNKSSLEEMSITEDMKRSFENDLQKRELSESKQKIFRGSCFDEDNNIIGEKIETCTFGTWDIIPRLSQECPYYKSNKNYPNDFGKLIDNYCELPNNMKLVGYRNYSKDPTFLPLCYNCEKDKRLFSNQTVGFCCDDQNDKDKYPNLITPDYVFKDDFNLRMKYKDNFEILNLSYN
jgi:hypothetical protein